MNCNSYKLKKFKEDTYVKPITMIDEYYDYGIPRKKLYHAVNPETKGTLKK